jgi:hypothetical protein
MECDVLEIGPETLSYHAARPGVKATKPRSAAVSMANAGLTAQGKDCS